MPRVPDNLHPNRMPPGVSHPVDIHVGNRVRQRRKLIGLSQADLGEALGLTFQQVQKYERGVNRIGASRLFQIAQILQINIDYFFAEMPSEIESESIHLEEQLHSKLCSVGDDDIISSEETTELVANYYAIGDVKKRKAAHDLIANLAKSEWPEIDES